MRVTAAVTAAAYLPTFEQQNPGDFGDGGGRGGGGAGGANIGFEGCCAYKCLQTTYLLCSLQYINKCTITVLTKKYFCIYYYVCAMNIVTIMLNNRSTLLLLDQLTIAITYYQFMKCSNTTKQFKNK